MLTPTTLFTEKLNKAISSIDTFYYTVIKREICDYIRFEIFGKTHILPFAFSSIISNNAKDFVKYKTSYYVKEDQFDKYTFVKFKYICDNKLLSMYKYLSEPQKRIFIKILEEDKDNEYVVVKDFVSVITELL